jgi:hypothetical protein
MRPASQRLVGDRRLTVLAAVAAVLIFGLTLVLFGAVNGFHQYADAQRELLRGAQIGSASAIERFRTDADVVAIAVVNDTGGTMQVYIGEIGAMHDVGDGVQTLASPTEVLTLGPHGRGPILIQNWRKKYVTSRTTYVFLGTINGDTMRLENASFYQVPNDSHAYLVYRAAFSPSDSNYRATSLEIGSEPKTGQEIAAQQDSAIANFEKSHRVGADDYPTSFAAYVRSWFGSTRPAPHL